MSIHFFLVRHALKEKAVGDVPITQDGIKQARSTAQYFSAIPIAAIVSSPLRRAKETAAYLAQATQSTVTIESIKRAGQLGRPARTKLPGICRDVGEEYART